MDSTPRGVKRKSVRLAELSPQCRKAHERVCALVDAGLPEGCPCEGLYSKDAQTVARLSSLAENGLGAQLPRLSAAAVEAIEELQAGRSKRLRLEHEEQEQRLELEKARYQRGRKS